MMALVLAWQAGPRSLNAIAAPVLAAVLLDGVLLLRGRNPVIESWTVGSGFQGAEVPLRLEVTGSGLASIEATLPPELRVPEIRTTTTLPVTIERTVALDQRGYYELESPTVRARGPLGLVGEAPVAMNNAAASDTVSTFVYPRIHPVPAFGGQGTPNATADGPGNQSFAGLREYTPDDPLRDVHWKVSARHDELQVVEYNVESDRQSVRIAASGVPDQADELASATASVALKRLDAGYSVGLVLPEGTLEPARGGDHRERLLELLARTEGGTATSLTDSDVTIRSRNGATLVHSTGRPLTFDAEAGFSTRKPMEAARP